ncbi:phosphatase PAP2 family protein [Methylobacterium sp. NMS14P]|uniref:phosphatase PAP2 family protein n=1 Tax=Methylobacterium sp. NMS14P TaxID=2894310 RepID=UPI0023593FAE|nr:phosphatase PAP2 family protein [Methylobacterium sp. NMS14P]WCS25528.1 phosphatase PAP2 family protein [Methylobacterium sp. NMS14P]
MRPRITGAGRRSRTACLAALVVFALPAALPAVAGTLHSTYIDPEALALHRVLPPPPEAGSEAARADLLAVEAAVGARTPDDERRITANRPCTLDRFTEVLGPALTARAMPVTAALIERVFQDGELFVLAAKTAIARPRPYTLEPDLATFGHRSDSTSYPSGHATFGYLAATVLAQLVPANRAALFAFAAGYGADRMIAGTHSPSDLEAGRIAAAVIAEALLRDPRFQRELDRARAEVSAAGGDSAR